MTKNQLSIFKDELGEQSDEETRQRLDDAATICSALAETLRQTEPYATSSISMLEKVGMMLSSDAED